MIRFLNYVIIGSSGMGVLSGASAYLKSDGGLKILCAILVAVNIAFVARAVINELKS